MSKTRTLAVVVLLVLYGAVGARQPAVRSSVPLGVSASAVASTLGFAAVDRGHLLVDVVRALFDAPDNQDASDGPRRASLTRLFQSPERGGGDLVPLPLDPSIWRDTLLQRTVPDEGLIAAIFADRRTALLYHGLAALDDETLGALGPDRETLQLLLRHPGAFAAFGRSLRIRGGRVVVPGGAQADAVWQAIVGVEPAKPGPFMRRLFSEASGRAAFFYDTVAHLDEPHQRFALGMSVPYTAKVDRARALYDLFVSIAPDWRVEDRPFNRPQSDPALTLALVGVTPIGDLAPPSHRRLWAHVLRGDEAQAVQFDPAEAAQVTLDADDAPADAAWLISRIHRAPAVVARRRLDVVLFAQRTLAAAADDAACAAAVRAFMAYPALTLSLERMGLASPDTIARAAARARSLNAIGDRNARDTAIRQFQALAGIADRAARLGSFDRREAGLRIASLLAVEPSERGYEGRLSQWIRGDLARGLPPPPAGTPSEEPLEASVLAAMAGVRVNQPDGPVIQWEGRAYRVDPARAEIARLLQVRRKQEGASLDAAVDAAIAAMTGEAGAAGERGRSGGQRRQALIKADRELADTLTSIVYAAYLGAPDGAALAGGNLALRHDLEGNTYSSANAWRLPYEDVGRGPRHVSGSLLGLDVALGPLALRRIDSSAMPPEPLMSRTDRMNAVHTVSFTTPAALSDAGRDEIAAALARGRTRLASMSAGRDEIERVAREAGLSEWRRESLAWTLAHDREAVPTQLSLVELLWLGAPRPSERARLDGWGAGVLALRGCMCLEMPKAQPWEDLAGHAPLGLLPSRGADVMLRIADALATLQLPATLAPAIASYAMQDVIDGAQPAYPDEWRAFSRAVLDLTNDRVADYIAALTAGGPLLRVQDTRGHP